MTEYTSAAKKLCSVYKSPRKSEMYLYVERGKPLDVLPDALKALFGEPEHVLDMVLTPDKTLARASADAVLKDIEVQGFYLQMPPGKDDYMLDLYPSPRDSLHG